MVFEGGRPRDQGQIMNWDRVLVLQPVHDIHVYMPPATQEPSAHYYRTSATFFSPRSSCRARLAHRSLLLLPSLRLGAGLSSTVHSFPSTHSSSIRAAALQPLSNQPPPPAPDPSTIHFQSFPTDTPPQSDESCQILGSWNPLGQLVIASLKLLVPAHEQD